jgi:hypothetical protein
MSEESIPSIRIDSSPWNPNLCSLGADAQSPRRSIGSIRRAEWRLFALSCHRRGRVERPESARLATFLRVPVLEFCTRPFSVASEQPAAARDSDGDPAGAVRQHPALPVKIGDISGAGPRGAGRRHSALPVKTGDISGAGAGAFSSRQSKPLRRRARELRLVELGEPAALPKGTRRRRKAWHKGTCPAPRQG